LGLELEYRFLGSESESGILYFLTWGRSPTKNKDSAFLVISGIFSQGTVAWGGVFSRTPVGLVHNEIEWRQWR